LEKLKQISRTKSDFLLKNRVFLSNLRSLTVVTHK